MTNNTHRKPRIFTLGHSDLSLDGFIKLLEGSSVRLVADVRSNPVSTRYPWFERVSFSSELGKRGLSYRWFRDLGGRRPPTPGESRHTALGSEGMQRYAAAMNTSGFDQSARSLVGLAASTVVVVMCAERHYSDCHRLLLADKLQLLGARVVHILGVDNAVGHTRHPDLEVVDGQMLYQKKQLELGISS